MKKTSLRAWLRRSPEPAKVVVRLEDGEERQIAIPVDIRNRWKTVESAVLASGGVAVSLFDKKGVMLRAQDLEDDEDEGEGAAEEQQSKAQSKMMREWTTMLQVAMHEQNTSFDKGVKAAAQSQESLVELVTNMSNHLTVTFTSLHNVVSSMAIMQQQHAEVVASLTGKIAELEGENGSSDKGLNGAISKLAGQVLAAGMGGGGDSNGASSPKPKKNKEATT